MLTKLTGGYRRTPVMQIGADIYCDTLCIMQEVEQRFPTPTFFPTSDAGLIWALSKWTDGALFDLTVKTVLGSAGDDLPKDFAEDRGRLCLGPDRANGLKAAIKAPPHLSSQMRAPMHWLNDQLSDDRSSLLGADPAAIDAQFYHIVWFLRGSWSHGPSFLWEFPNLERWEANVNETGYGDITGLSPEDAILQAINSEPLPLAHEDMNDPQGLAVGMNVIVSPDLDGVERPVQGALVASDCELLVVRRIEPDVGIVHVHFPRVGYRVTSRI